MEYRIFGPFALPTDDKNNLDFTLNGRKRFWSEAKEETGYDLQNGWGCYLYVVRAGKGITPWYVGQSKGPFSREVFATNKQERYNSVHDSYQKGTSMLFLITRFTKGKGSISITYASPCPALFVDAEERSGSKREIQGNRI